MEIPTPDDVSALEAQLRVAESAERAEARVLARCAAEAKAVHEEADEAPPTPPNTTQPQIRK